MHTRSDMITRKHTDYLQNVRLRTNRGFLPVDDDIPKKKWNVGKCILEPLIRFIWNIIRQGELLMLMQ